ncbi:hypothetical protein MNV49_002596 [Pseudohyphozyma bogoriensis]|nr:hypothetical protein MNV49_002596 [Pseudohyphozyma bogoriensis]
MSTSSRVNKSTTKFVPKRKAGPSGPRAASATPSISGTPRVEALKDLPSIDELELTHSPAAAARALVDESAEVEFAVPSLPVRKAVAAPAPVTTGLGLAFGPSDPSASTSFTASSSAPSSSSFGFTPRDPSASFPSTAPTSSFAPSSSPPRAKGTPFGISVSGPTLSSSSPPSRSASHAPAAGVGVEAGPSSASTRARSSSPRNQREIEAEAIREVEERKRKEEERKKVAREKREANKKKKEEAAAAAAGESEKAKGKKRAVEENEEEEEEDSAPKGKGKGKGRPRAKRVAAATGDDSEEEEFRPTGKRQGGSRAASKFARWQPGDDGEEEDSDASDASVVVQPKRKRQRKKKAPGKVDRLLMGIDRLSDAEELEGEKEGEESGEESGEEGTAKAKKDAPPVKKRATSTFVRTVVNPEITKMSDLATARDTVDGRISSRGRDLQAKADAKKAARKAARLKMKERAARRARGEPSESEEEGQEEGAGGKEETPAPRATREVSVASAAVSRAGSPALLDAFQATLERGEGDGEVNQEEGEEDGDDSDDMGDLQETQYAPQMRIVDGQLVIDDASLEVDRANNMQVEQDGPREIIEESARDRFVNSATWGKQQRTEKWTAEETTFFYECLGRFGTDFEMIAGLFPTRTRRQIKAKWNKEDRINPKGITAALMQRKDMDLESYAKITGQDLSGPIPDDPYEKIQKLREEAQLLELQNLPTWAQKKVEENVEVGRVDGVGGEGVEAELAAVEAEMEEDEGHDSEEEERRQAEIDREIEEAAQEERRGKKGKR